MITSCPRAVGAALALLFSSLAVAEQVPERQAPQGVRDLFALELVSASVYDPETLHPVRARAVSPWDGFGFEGVEVLFELWDWSDGDEDESAELARCVTDSAGECEVALGVPWLPDGAEIEATARHLDQVRVTSLDLMPSTEAKFVLSTDREIYRPGDEIHIRVLGVWPQDPDGSQPRLVELEARDEEHRELFREELEVSDFGVASTSWTLSERRPPRQVHLNVSADGVYRYRRLEVSTEPTPRFSVDVELDRTYYQPGDTAVVSLEATSFSGASLGSANVTIYRTETGQAEDRLVAQSTLDATGRSTVALALSDFWSEDTLGERSGSHYSDVQLSVVVDDPDSPASERREATLRISRDPIHVYLRTAEEVDREGLPRAWVTCFEADGAPMSCDVEIRSVSVWQAQDGSITEKVGPVVGGAQTGEFGVGDVTWTDSGVFAHGGRVSLMARGRDGLSGRSNGWVGTPSGSRIAMRAPTFLRHGSPLILSVSAPGTSSEDAEAISGVRLELWSQSERGSERVGVKTISELSQPRTVRFEPRPEWSGVLRLFAFDQNSRPTAYFDPSVVAGSTSVLVLGSSAAVEQDLGVWLTMDEAEYRPGARARLRVRTDAEDQDAVVGLVAVDADLRELERIRFGYDEDPFLRDIGPDWSAAVGPWTLQRLSELGPDEIVGPNGLALEPVAALLLSQSSWLGFQRTTASPIHDIQREGSAHFQRWDARHVSASFKSLSARDVLDSRKETLARQLLDRATSNRARSSADPSVDPSDDIASDPWGTRYRFGASLSPQRPTGWGSTVCELSVESAGLDRAWGTVDDFVAGRFRNRCFRALDKALQGWLDELVSSGKKLPAEGQLLSPGFLDLLDDGPEDLGLTVEGHRVLDPWSNPVSFRWSGSRQGTRLKLASEGRDAETRGISSGSIAYRLPRALVTEIEAGLRTTMYDVGWPSDDEQLSLTFSSVLRSLDLESIYDPWGQPVFPHFERIGTSATGAPRAVDLRSSGHDGLRGTQDDFSLARLGCLRTRPSPWADDIPHSALGTVEGVVIDGQGFALPGVTVEICGLHKTATVVSDEEGRFAFSRWPAGPVVVMAQLDGFTTAATEIEVRPDSSNAVQLVMLPASEETITVTSEAPLVETYSVSAGAVVPDGDRSRTQLVTPPVRRDFRDTLIFVPEQSLVRGETEIEVPLADDVTSWNVSAIVSTRDGRLGTATTTIPVRLPLWIETRWPNRVTAGDQLSLPVHVRNRSEGSRDLDWQARAAGVELSSPEGALYDIGSSDTVHLETHFRSPGGATVTVDVRDSDGDLGDSLEQELTVRPDGYRLDETWGGLIEGTTSVDLSTPGQVLDVPTTVEMKVYVDLMDHVVDAVRGLVRRPVGCMEQILSTAHGSLLTLELLGEDKSTRPQLTAEARRYVDLAARQIVRSRGVGSDVFRPGGVAYWPGGIGDIALSAYALDFLERASDYVVGYEREASNLARWLAEHQHSVAPERDRGSLNRAMLRRDRRQRLFVAWSLARYLDASEEMKRDEQEGLRETLRQSVLESLRQTELDVDRAEPYLASVRGLAALALGEADEARRSGELLASWVEREDAQASWPLAGTTPFWGRDFAGRIETTGLAVQLLSLLEGHDELARAGATWLLEHKLLDGAWSTTQATAQALRALSRTLGGVDQHTRFADGSGGEEVLKVQVGERLLTVPSNRPSGGGPRRLVFEVPTLPGEPVSLRMASERPVFVQSTTSTWVPWSSVRGRAESDRLSFDVDCGRPRLRVGELVECRAEISRAGIGGMLVAEIGLPPGVQVDRDDLRASRGWASQWSVDEDRVLAYVYPDRGRATLEIRFRPLLAFEGQSTKSSLWDYYDPDSEIVLPPRSFRVKRE